MRKKIGTLIFVILTILLFLVIAAFVFAKGGGGGGGIPCSGAHWSGYGLYKDKCWNGCGSPSACHNYYSGQKGGCVLGQICDDGCNCKWVDKDLDGYTTESCGEYVGKSGWLIFEEADIISGETYEWDLENKVSAQSIRIVQTRGLTVTKIFSIEVHDEEGVYMTYDFSEQPFQLLKTQKFSENFEETVEVNKVVVNWDDDSKSNMARLEIFVGPASTTCDCDDYNPHTRPYAQEVCDNADNDCDGEVDEDEVCEKYIYLCKSDNFIVQYEGLGRDISFGYCADGTWCSGRAVGESGSCDYETEEEDLGQNEFYSYICDINTCYKFTEGSFMVCGYGWSCTAMCTPGDCDPISDPPRWCNSLGVWQVEGWCQSECGKADSNCGGNCKNDVCDIYAQKWCKNGYWVDDNYCDCDVCGSLDSTCLTGCSCEEGECDTANDAICENGFWETGSDYCWTGCCQEDYNCYAGDICETCESGTCDTKNNQYCLGGVWIRENYCVNCEEYDYDCGTGPCEHGTCDIAEKKYCLNGVWTDPGASYCKPGYCGSQDDSCKCSSDKDGCCKAVSDGTCDHDCMQGADPDCPTCTQEADDCCYDLPGDGCDLDCVPGVDPDCQDDCDIKSDDCCSDLADGNCDPDCTENSDIDCVDYCTEEKGDCCLPDNDGVCDPDCIPGVDPNCAASPCEENWVCKKWDQKCEGVNEIHECKKWEDTNDCNTFYDKPGDVQNCYKEFTCGEDDDKDGDGYPWRACYDVVNGVVLEELDCKGDGDEDSSRNPGAEEVCNGLDDNCDGSVDEGCPCVEGEDPQQCGRTEGICKPGIQICEAGYWGVCGGSGYVGPQKEVCDDGLDNNCDSFIDENCNCIEGERQDCGSDVGVCKKGWQACYHGSFGSVCNDVVEGVTEVCDNSLDDDCDSYVDGDDSNCQVTTPVTTGPGHCKNRKQDGDEEGIDCGGVDCEGCEEKPPACDYGRIVKKCVCGAAAYKTGYCCNGKYSLVACKEQKKDTDNDGCYDDNELQMGTDVYSDDTDGDGLLDCESDEMYPLCNEDGTCDAENDYPETLENCPQDCGAGLGLLMWVLVVLVVLALMGVGGYLYAKSRGYKFSDFVKIKGKEKEGKPKFQFGAPAKISPKTTSIKRAPQVAANTKKDIIQLNAFVRTSLKKKGYTKLQIRQAALKEGWTKEQIDEALKGKKSKYKLF